MRQYMCHRVIRRYEAEGFGGAGIQAPLQICTHAAQLAGRAAHPLRNVRYLHPFGVCTTAGSVRRQQKDEEATAAEGRVCHSVALPVIAVVFGCRT
eukprot:scaffold609_cov345-Prasinococcus_capsulatus_cf.AAC.1